MYMSLSWFGRLILNSGILLLLFFFYKRLKNVSAFTFHSKVKNVVQILQRYFLYS